MRQYTKIRAQYGYNGSINDRPLSENSVLLKRAPFKEEILPKRKMLQKIMLLLVITLFLGGMGVAGMLLGIIAGNLTGNEFISAHTERYIVTPAAAVLALAMSFIFIFSKRIKQTDAKYHAIKDYEYVGVSLAHAIGADSTAEAPYIDGDQRYYEALKRIASDTDCHAYLRLVIGLERLLTIGEFNMLAQHYLGVNLDSIYAPTKRAERYLELLV